MTNVLEMLRQPLALRHMRLPNRFIRSATYEGMADAGGDPTEALAALYRELVAGGVGTLITGFLYVSAEGRAMQPAQCGMEAPERTDRWKPILASLRRTNPVTKVVAQIAHTGRQTRSTVSGQKAVGAGTRACTFFHEHPRTLATGEVAQRAEQFGRSAAVARDAGFDAVQIHAAHGYLVHQFLSPWTNRRRDRWGAPHEFLLCIIDAVRRHAGEDYPIWVKLSWAEDRQPGIDLTATAATVRALDTVGVDAIEISYGTMEWPMSIFRGDCPISIAMRVNPLLSRHPAWIRAIWLALAGRRHLRRLRPFAENYNALAASELQRHVETPIIPVGGIRSLDGIAHCLGTLRLPAVSLCRPLVCDPRLPNRFLMEGLQRSNCSNCNLCAVYCDSHTPLRCHAQHSRKESLPCTTL